MEEPRVLEYFPEKQRTDSSAIAWFQFVFPLLVGAMLLAVLPSWALPGAVAAALCLWWWRRQRKKLPHMTLRIESGSLTVHNAHGTVVFDATLDELDDVMLDTKTIERVQENMSSGMPMTRFVDSTVGPSIDTSRIELISDDVVTRLTEEYTSNIDATEWFSKIRRFLRKGGWVPLLERDEG